MPHIRLIVLIMILALSVQGIHAYELQLLQTLGFNHGAAEIYRPCDVVFAEDSTAYVCCEGNCRVLRFDADWNFLSSFAGRGQGPGEFEQPTDGYYVIDGHVHYLFSGGGLLHSVDLMVENAADKEFYNHLSRVKSVMPEPGRNIKFMYKIYF